MGTRGSIGISGAVNEHADARTLAIEVIPKNILQDGSVSLSYNDTVLADSPILFVRGGDVGPTIITEDIFGFNGVAVNGPTFGAAGLVVGGPDDSMSYSAASLQQLQMLDKDIYTFSDGVDDKPFSFEAMVHITNLSDHRAIFAKAETPTTFPEYIYFVSSAGALEIVLYDGTSANNHGFVSTAGDIIINNTYHVVGTYTGIQNSGILYINGLPVASTNFNNGSYVRMINTITHFRIGSYFYNEVSARKHMEGREAKSALYDYVLSPAQILTHFEATGL